MRKEYLLIFDEIGMIASDSFRSRAYLQLLVKNNLIPNHIILISDKKKLELKEFDTNNIEAFKIKPWDKLVFDPFISIFDTIKKYNLKHNRSITDDINSEDFYNLLKIRKEKIFIYSGLPGVLLKEKLFTTNKKFLHSHGGFLPNFKGSTTNYYSLLEKNTISASSLFLNNKIDSGDVLKRFTTKIEKNKNLIDNIFDPMIRAKVLIDTVKDINKRNKIKFLKINENNSKNYYIIHPILKHIAILQNEKK